MKELLTSGDNPASSYFADNDHIAIGAIRALVEAGYRIPEDVAVVGFDDIPLCNYMNPPLTTVQVPKRFYGETAAVRVIQLVENKNSQPLKIEVNTPLIKRKSV